MTATAQQTVTGMLMLMGTLTRMATEMPMPATMMLTTAALEVMPAAMAVPEEMQTAMVTILGATRCSATPRTIAICLPRRRW